MYNKETSVHMYMVPLKCKLPLSCEARLVSLKTSVVSLETSLVSLKMNFFSFESFLLSRECTGSTNGLHCKTQFKCLNTMM